MSHIRGFTVFSVPACVFKTHKSSAFKAHTHTHAQKKTPRATDHSQVLPILLLRSQTTFLHDPVVGSEILAPITAVVALPPRAVHQLLLGEAHQVPCLDRERARCHVTHTHRNTHTPCPAKAPADQFPNTVTFSENALVYSPLHSLDALALLSCKTTLTMEQNGLKRGVVLA